MNKSKPQKKFTKIPQHIAIIMDGNGRWAAAHGLPRLAGHKAGTENLRQVLRAAVEFGVKYLTIYAFSTENWRRPKEEVKGLMLIVEDVIERELAELHREGVQLRHIGRLEGLRPQLIEKIKAAIELTKDNKRLVLCIAFNYGGRDEIACAIKRMLNEQLDPDTVSEDLIGEYLFTSGVPDPDLIVRTSGEMRISNFLIWQSAYAEWYISPTYWPDFDKEELRKAIIEFGLRDRRYGKISSNQVES
ncbi:MAG: isoprenyl transferase [Anaerolineaceae bacterium]|nr:isoprenyl transferase [Anaerolineaceae bacterium]MBN2677122.1 isoprenyl transferase [Anaerolineaceae bacterium]